MKNIFPKTNAYWAKYSEYEYRRSEDGELYLMPAPNAKPSVYDPMKEPESIVVDALNVGRLAMKRGNEKQMREAVMEFVSKYGLLGFMPALPTTTAFLNYDAVYFDKNHFIKSESLPAQNYLAHFFSFHKPDIYKDRDEARWSIKTDYNSREAAALTMTFASEPIAVGMSLLPIYAERFDWLATQFRDWAYVLTSTFLFYEHKDEIDEATREIYRQGVAAFGDKAPTYHISLRDDRPQIVWDFHSLRLTIQTLFGFALTDESRPLRICKHCNQAFIAGHPNAAFCSPECKNKYNVYKNRGKKEQDIE